MDNRRRSVLKRGVLLASAAILSRTFGDGRAQAGSDFVQAHDENSVAMQNFFEKLGYHNSDRSPIVTNDHDFNGGLRFDETGLLSEPGQMVTQRCARLEDIEKKGRPDTLPIFNIFACNRSEGTGVTQSTAQLLSFLVDVGGIDPRRLAIVSTPRISEFLSVFKAGGIDISKQIHLREELEAMEAMDGSGYFRFPGQSQAPVLATAGIYCWIGKGTPQNLVSYPPPADWTELGEICLDENEPLAFGVGTERLTLASSGLTPTWDEHLAILLSQIDSDSNGAISPPGREIFEKG